MAYRCELATGQTLYLDNPSPQTVITTASRQSGQQQQSSQSLTTGPWTALPAIFAAGTGAAIRLTTAQGEFWVQIQGSQLSGLASAPPNPGSPLPLQASGPIPNSPPTTSMPPTTPMPPMSPMPPMPPMTPMSPMPPMPPMSLGHPMEMRMGNMEMRMPPLPGPITPPDPAGSPAPAATAPKFCSQCGAALRSGDRFCSSCGHPIGSVSA
jgi:zinc-ribbon domain